MLQTITWPHKASQVQVAGTWNNWQQQDMKYDVTSDQYIFHIDIAPGDTYQYKFIVDGKWCLDKDVPAVTADDGHQNHEIVGEGDMVEEKIDLPAFDLATARPPLRTPQIVMEAATPSHIEEDHFTEWIMPDDNEPTDNQEWNTKSNEKVESDMEEEEVERWNGTAQEDPHEKIDDIIPPAIESPAPGGKLVKAPVNWSLAGGVLVAVVAIVAYIGRQRSFEVSMV
ncbi:hypothetical protein INT44_008297 [Umbelopsis vinacea]|uniref:AMP-activated protein kinase glycogen-binding domain-containing protein n=1 Tax=Umbelopsis vinacea TaxID=44442 RepID=A0A8H7PVQ0_9FUNG|nr:hypothetical protein INT44_008297 [Umbelopsis vinacea]